MIAIPPPTPAHKITTSTLDTNTYTTYTLPNNIKLVHAIPRDLTKSAIALSVRAGTYSESQKNSKTTNLSENNTIDINNNTIDDSSEDMEIPGIAHFTEHMLFMGTEMFPGENDFMEYLGKHNGSSNGYTANDHTMYYFDIDTKYFLEHCKDRIDEDESVHTETEGSENELSIKIKDVDENTKEVNDNTEITKEINDNIKEVNDNTDNREITKEINDNTKEVNDNTDNREITKEINDNTKEVNDNTDNRENTSNYKCVDAKSNAGSLTRFTHFFKTPLFLSSSVDRELLAVDSEFKNNILNDDWRTSRITEIIKNEPYSGFGTGNIDTLRIDNIRDLTYQFYKNNYCASGMCVAVFCEDGIKDRILDYFGGIKNNTEKKNGDNEENLYKESINLNDESINLNSESIHLNNDKNNCFVPHVFKDEFKNRFIFIEPITDIKELKIEIEVPMFQHNYKNNMLGFIMYLLSKQEKKTGDNVVGSLINTLKGRGLAFQLSVNYNFNLYYTVFDINVSLSKKGFEEKENVLNTVHDFIRELWTNIESVVDKESKVYKYLAEEYENLRTCRHKQFRYMENTDNLDSAIDISEKLQYFPIENVLDYDYLYESFCFEEFKEIVRLLERRRDSVVILVGKGNMDSAHLVEKYYGIKYRIGEEFNINEIQTDSKCNTKIEHIVYEKGVNNYMGNKIDDEVKVNSFDKKHGCYKILTNLPYQAPKAYISILINTKIRKEEYTSLMFYINILNEHFFEKYGDSMYLNSITINTKNYTKGVEFVFDNMKSYTNIEEDNKRTDVMNSPYFGLIKERLLEDFMCAKQQSPYKRIFTTCMEKLVPERLGVEQAIEKITRFEREDIRRGYFDSVYIEMFVCGNIDVGVYEKIYKDLRSRLGEGEKYKTEEITVEEFGDFKKINNKKELVCGNKMRVKSEKNDLCDNIDELEDNSEKRIKSARLSNPIPVVARIKFETQDNTNNVVAVLIHCDYLKNKTKLAIDQLINSQTQEPFFDNLRTKETLGYIVSSRLMPLNDKYYLYYLVQSEKDCEFLEERILKFLNYKENSNGLYESIVKKHGDELSKDVYEEIKEKVGNDNEHVNEYRLGYELDDDELECLKESVVNMYDGELKSVGEYFDYHLNLFSTDRFELGYGKSMIEVVRNLKKDYVMFYGKAVVVHAEKKKIQ